MSVSITELRALKAYARKVGDSVNNHSFVKQKNLANHHNPHIPTGFVVFRDFPLLHVYQNLQ